MSRIPVKQHRPLKWIGTITLVLIGVLATYEGFALYQAKQATPLIIQRAAQGELQLPNVPRRRLAMLLKIEDPSFYQHKGIDFATPGQGLTSLTQSLVKRFYFENFEPGFAKLEQSLIARFILNSAMSKDAQLVAFLNHSNFGNVRGRPVIGFADAARTYYDREMVQLDDRQFLALVAMLIAPNQLDPLRHPEANADRVKRIQHLLNGTCAPTGLLDVKYESCA